jgi:hypothetical protein
MSVQLPRQEGPRGDIGFGAVVEYCLWRVSRGKRVAALERNAGIMQGQDIYRLEPVQWFEGYSGDRDVM